MTTIDDQTRAWIRLSAAEGLTALEMIALVRKAGTPEAVFNAGAVSLSKMAGADVARRVLSAECRETAERVCCYLAENPAVQAVTIGDNRYPSAMIEAGVAPAVLYCRGNVALLNAPGTLAVSGSSRPDSEADRYADYFGEMLGALTRPLSLRLVPGVEARFLRAALRAGKAPLTVWGAAGPDRLWPNDGRDSLTALLAAGGLWVTPFMPGVRMTEGALVFQAVCRMAASVALLVLRAGIQSGSLKTARLAADWGRDVYAVPGSVFSPLSVGCHRLIRDGARLFDSPVDFSVSAI